MDYAEIIKNTVNFVLKNLNIKIYNVPEVKIIKDFSKPHSFGMFKNNEIIINLHFPDEKALAATLSHELSHFILKKLNIKLSKEVEEVLCTIIHTLTVYSLFKTFPNISDDKEYYYKIGKILGEALAKCNNPWTFLKRIVASLKS